MKGRSAILTILLLGLLAASLAKANCSVDGGGAACALNADPGSSQQSTDGLRHVGNPVDLISGNKYQYELDYLSPDSALRFARYYNSNLESIDARLGHGWRHSYMVRLVSYGDDELRIAQSDGRLLRFHRIHDAVPGDQEPTSAVDEVGNDETDKIAPNQRSDTVSLYPQIYHSDADGTIERIDRLKSQWTSPDGDVLYFHGSFLVRIEATTPKGSRLNLQYEGGRLSRVSDEQDNELQLVYAPGRLIDLPQFTDKANATSPGHLIALKLPDGSTIDFRYDNARNLSLVEGGLGADIQYQYQAEGYPHHLTERRAGNHRPALVESSWILWHSDYLLPDEREVFSIYSAPSAQSTQITRWDYDNNGRVSRYRSADGRVNLRLSYRQSSTGQSGATTVDSDSNTQRTYHWQRDENGYASIRRIDYQDCDNCPVVRTELPARSNRIQNRGIIPGGGNNPKVLSAPCGLPPGVNCNDIARDIELAEISSCAYADACAVKGWTQLSAQQVGIPNSLLEDGPFSATVYESNLTGEWVVAFRGTNNISDIPADYALGTGRRSKQIENATRIAKEITRVNVGKDVHFTGHSLGGALATAAALEYGSEATIFNPAWLSKETADNYQLPFGRIRSSVERIYIRDELVHNIQGKLYAPSSAQPDPLYPVEKDLTQPNYSGYVLEPKYISDGSTARHYIANVIDSLNYLFENNLCNAPSP